MSSMRFPSREEVEKVRNEYPKGCRVVLERMDDMQAPPIGTEGTVRGVDDTVPLSSPPFHGIKKRTPVGIL